MNVTTEYRKIRLYCDTMSNTNNNDEKNETPRTRYTEAQNCPVLVMKNRNTFKFSW